MTSETYFKSMKETSRKVDNNVILPALGLLKLDNPEMYDAVAALAEKRKGQPKLRAHLVRRVYEICKGPKDGWIKLAAAVELELNSMYYKNQVFDEKAGCTTKDSVIKNWCADSYSRDLAEEILQESYPNNNELIILLRAANRTFAIGQYRDVFQNVYSQLESASYDQRMDLCFDRIYEINTSFFEKCARMATIIAQEKDEHKIDALYYFGESYGTAVQIVNDIADFVPPRLNTGTSEKTSDDAYSDVKSGKMTYPVIYLLHNGTKKEIDLLKDIFEKGPNADLNQLKELTKILVRSGAIDFAKKQAKIHKNQAKESLRNEFSKKQRRHLSEMCAMFDKNRYYDALKEFEK